ncbi:MAG: biopolymer transporter ExbD [Myxococcaceae bacterium]
MRRRVPDEAPDTELNLVPYLDILMNLILFLLLSIAGLATMAALPISTSRGGNATGPSASISLRIGAEGFELEGERLARDLPGLRGALVKARERAGALVLTAEPDTDYQLVIAVIDAAREQDDHSPLFTDIKLQ